MSKIFVPAYWPMFKTNEQRRFDYKLPNDPKVQFSSIFSYDAKTDSMLYLDRDANGVWTDTWLYQYRPGSGIVEWRDDYPTSTKVFSTPIKWGELQNVGDMIDMTPIVNVFKTWPPMFPIWGKQVVKFEAVLDSFTLNDGTVYHNVLQVLYQQTWGKTGGARYWFAYGVGPIALEWVAPDPATGKIVTVGRYDASPSALIA